MTDRDDNDNSNDDNEVNESGKTVLNHRLMRQLTAADGVTEEEIAELFDDLKQIYENPFDAPIEAALARGSCYIELPDQAFH